MRKAFIINSDQIDILERSERGAEILLHILIKNKNNKPLQDLTLSKELNLTHSKIRTITKKLKDAQSNNSQLANNLITTQSQPEFSIYAASEEINHNSIATTSQPNHKTNTNNQNYNENTMNNLPITEKRIDLSQSSERFSIANTINQQPDLQDINRQARSARSEANEVSEAEKGHYTQFCQEIKSFVEEQVTTPPAKPKKARKSQRERDMALVPVTAETEDAYKVFQHWKTRMNHPRAAFTYKQYSYIKPVLDNLEYGVDGAIQAIDGCAKSEWHMGRNDQGKVYDTLDLIMRPGKIENFIKVNNLNETDFRNTRKKSPAEERRDMWAASHAIVEQSGVRDFDNTPRVPKRFLDKWKREAEEREAEARRNFESIQ